MGNKWAGQAEPKTRYPALCWLLSARGSSWLLKYVTAKCRQKIRRRQRGAVNYVCSWTETASSREQLLPLGVANQETGELKTGKRRSLEATLER